MRSKMVDSEGKNIWNLDAHLEKIRKNFPILDRCVYLISNSLGAVPARTQYHLQKFYHLWAEEGVTAWDREWWNLAQKAGNQVAHIIGSGEDEVTMLTNATLCHWVSLSTKFHASHTKKDKVVMTDHDFPSIIYAVAQICEFMNWKLDIVESHGHSGIDVNEIVKKVDETTLFVTTSHVYFKSAYVQDISRVAKHAREVGALTLIDGYHAPGTLPVDVKALGVDFYVGGCLKWLCGGPGNAFLYVRPEIRHQLEPSLTGWLAHENPFAFMPNMIYTEGSYRFMSGTPPVACLYGSLAGLDIIKKLTVSQIRKKSLSQTKKIMDRARERTFDLYTPCQDRLRGGAVSVGMPHAYQVKQALSKRGIKVDFRKGQEKEPDVIRIGPHFYTKDEEINFLFEQIDDIYASREFEHFPEETGPVT